MIDSRVYNHATSFVLEQSWAVKYIVKKNQFLNYIIANKCKLVTKGERELLLSLSVKRPSRIELSAKVRVLSLLR